jgi:hypothetical protein
MLKSTSSSFTRLRIVTTAHALYHVAKLVHLNMHAIMYVCVYMYVCILVHAYVPSARTRTLVTLHAPTI